MGEIDINEVVVVGVLYLYADMEFERWSLAATRGEGMGKR